MHKFLSKLFRFTLIGLIPLTITAIIYITLDPFKVIYKYDSYVDTDSKHMVPLNQDYVSTTTFINNSEKINYNSFIFGNSRSMFFQVTDWKKYLEQNATCYHFDAFSESLWGLNKKIEYVDKKGSKLDNILLVLDYSTLIQDKPQSGHLFITPPALVDNSNVFDFHKTFFFAFLSPKFLYTYTDFKISGEVKPYMRKSNLLDDDPKNYDVLTNEVRFDYFENLILEDKYYTPERLSVFYERDTINQKFSPECIFENQKLIFNNILRISKKHNTNIKIIINPLYDQLKLNTKDLMYLKKLFGKNNVYDFSGINSFTNNYKNYYENSHYRPHLAREMMKIVHK